MSTIKRNGTDTMKDRKLPVILSLPHGGFGIPAELEGRLAITECDIYNECDLWIGNLFDFRELPAGDAPSPDVLARVTTTVARSLIDVNREPNDLDNPDGPVKAHTSYGRSTCVEPLSLAEKKALVDQYLLPYHGALEAAWIEYGSEAKLFLDCHNMAQTGPTAYGDSGSQRPLICLANLGAAGGSALPGHATSCSPDYIQRAAAAAEEVFAGLTLLEPLPGPPPPTIAINVPYNGGYILRRYAELRAQYALPPGLMIEFNRGLYVGNQNATSAVAPPNVEQIEPLRARILEWLLRIVDLARAE